MAKIQARKMGSSTLLQPAASHPFRLAWLLPRTDAAERAAKQRVNDNGTKKKSLLVRVRTIPGGFEGYALKSKTPHTLQTWQGSDWELLEIDPKSLEKKTKSKGASAPVEPAAEAAQ